MPFKVGIAAASVGGREGYRKGVVRGPLGSVGRDEQARFWDGLLGSDWIGKLIY